MIYYTVLHDLNQTCQSRLESAMKETGCALNVINIMSIDSKSGMVLWDSEVPVNIYIAPNVPSYSYEILNLSRLCASIAEETINVNKDYLTVNVNNLTADEIESIVGVRNLPITRNVDYNTIAIDFQTNSWTCRTAKLKGTFKTMDEKEFANLCRRTDRVRQIFAKKQMSEPIDSRSVNSMNVNYGTGDRVQFVLPINDQNGSIRLKGTLVESKQNEHRISLSGDALAGVHIHVPHNLAENLIKLDLSKETEPDDVPNITGDINWPTVDGLNSVFDPDRISKIDRFRKNIESAENSEFGTGGGMPWIKETDQLISIGKSGPVPKQDIQEFKIPVGDQAASAEIESAIKNILGDVKFSLGPIGKMGCCGGPDGVQGTVGCNCAKGETCSNCKCR